MRPHSKKQNFRLQRLQKQREEFQREIIKCEELEARSRVKSAIDVLYQRALTSFDIQHVYR